ncbi:DUF551 domain-containing protein [Serratia marcescens]|nr:DUF551 domain-containing protein [Serratia marcescens]
MTLTTTEELKHLASSDNTNELTRRLARECLANREAQPVAWRHDDGPFAGIAITRAKSVADSWIAKGWTVTPLYTAPPAPVVVKLPAEFYSGEGIVVRLEEVMAALAVVGVQFERKANVKTRCEFPAPAVPKEMTVEQAYENVQTWHYANGWNACRAAMLAQPVSQSYTLNSPAIPDGWVACSDRMPEDGAVVLCCEGGDISTLFHRGNGIWDDGDFHSHITGITHWMPLPAAPEGGK